MDAAHIRRTFLDFFREKRALAQEKTSESADGEVPKWS